MGYDPYRQEARRLSDLLVSGVGVGFAMLVVALLRDRLGFWLAVVVALGASLAVDLLVRLVVRHLRRAGGDRAPGPASREESR